MKAGSKGFARRVVLEPTCRMLVPDRVYRHSRSKSFRHAITQHHNSEPGTRFAT